MLDKSIPYHSVIMAADRWTPPAPRPLPPGYTLRAYQDADALNWARIETSVGEFPTQEKALEYWDNQYRPRLAMVRERCLFACDPQGLPVATCTAWAQDDLYMIHWVATCPAEQGQGLAQALVSRAMELFDRAGTFPVILHTQTWSHQAMRLYHRLGFFLLRESPAQWGENEFDAAMETLRGVLTPGQWQALWDTARDTLPTL
jgi:ribosomal protein S18 acetylase RimI-like enzyme